MLRGMLRVLLVTLGILLVPVVAMRFTHEVNWTGLDFAVAAALLITTGLIYELGVRKVRGGRARLACAVGLLGLFLLVWAQLAVGIV